MVIMYDYNTDRHVCYGIWEEPMYDELHDALMSLNKWTGIDPKLYPKQQHINKMNDLLSLELEVNLKWSDLAGSSPQSQSSVS